MFKLVIVLSALCCIGVLVYVHSVLIYFPPKARLLCDIWAMVENPVKKDM